MALYIDGCFPLQCENCRGYGEVRGAKLCPDSCTCMGRLHGYGDAVCPECDGRGVKACQICGDEAAVGLDEDGDMACPLCLQAEAEELALERSKRVLVGD